MDASKAGPAVTRSRSVLKSGSVPLEKEKRTASRRKGKSIGKGGKQPGDGVAAASNIVSTMETRKKPRVDYTDAKWEKLEIMRKLIWQSRTLEGKLGETMIMELSK